MEELWKLHSADLSRAPNELIADFSVKGMIHALTIRSPIAKGSLKEIVSPKLPPSFYLITAEHIPGENSLADFPVRVLADKELSYIGQPVAILAGPEKLKLKEIFSQIKVIAEEQAPDFSEPEENIIVRRYIEQGAFNYPEERRIVSGVYRTGIQEHWYAEAHGAVVVVGPPPWAGKGKKQNAPQVVTVYTASQWPFHVKRSVTRVLGMESESITVNPTLMIQPLDGKIWYPSLVACHAALAAWVSKKPAKLMLTREEDFMYSPKRNASEINIKSDLSENNEVLATEISLALDLGAEAIFQDEIIDQTCLGALGTYRQNAVKLNAKGLRTNIPPQGPMAGFGLSQGFFASERHISRLADTLGQDPAQWRKNNFCQKKEGFAIGSLQKSPSSFPLLIDKAAAMSDYYRKWASYELLRSRRREEKLSAKPLLTMEALRGIGIATACQGMGFLNNSEANTGNRAVEITLEKDGFLEIKMSFGSSGPWHLNNWLRLAEEILGIEPEFVRLSCNTLEAPDSGPGTLSRAVGITGKLIERCLMAIRKQRFRDPLPITVKKTASASKAPLGAEDRLVDTESFARPGWAAAITEIEVDMVSFDPVIRGIWLAVDAGKLINEKRALRVLKTSAVHALGWASREQVSYVAGEIPAGCCRVYDIPAPGEIPPVEVNFIKSDNSVCKGIGDLPFSCIPAAYVQAVSQAMDHHFESIPLDTREIWQAWKLKQTEGGL